MIGFLSRQLAATDRVSLRQPRARRQPPTELQKQPRQLRSSFSRVLAAIVPRRPHHPQRRSKCDNYKIAFDRLVHGCRMMHRIRPGS